MTCAYAPREGRPQCVCGLSGGRGQKKLATRLSEALSRRQRVLPEDNRMRGGLARNFTRFKIVHRGLSCA